MEKLLTEDDCVMKDKEISVFVDNLADHAVVIGARGWVKNEEFWPTQWRLLEKIKLSFDEAFIWQPKLSTQDFGKRPFFCSKPFTHFLHFAIK